jgi:Fe-only nitrogenase accessory protein AnfO
MEIAVLVNNEDEIIASNEDGVIKVFSKDREEWKVVREIPFEINKLASPTLIRAKLKDILELLAKCRVIAAREVKGMVYTILDGNRFNIWNVEGNPTGFLDYIYEKEEQEKKEKVKSNDKITPKQISEGNFYIDLKEIMENNEKVTSKQVLLPFLSSNKFDKLEIICSHMPKWFNMEFERLNLCSECTTISENEIKVEVFPKGVI